MSITKTDSIVSTHARKIAIADIIEPIRPEHPATKRFVDEFVGGSLNYLGLWDASTGEFPPNPVEQVFYIISITGDIDGTTYHSGDWIIYFQGAWLQIPISQWVSTSTIVANAPLVYDAGVLSIGAADGATPGYVTTVPQTFDGRKTFVVVPTIPLTPVADTDMASKGYVDQEVAAAVGEIPVLPITYSSRTIYLNPASHTTTNKLLYITSTQDTSGLGTGSFSSLGGASFGDRVEVHGRITVVSTSGYSPSMIGGSGSVLNLTAAAIVQVPLRMRAITPVIGTDLVIKSYADTQVSNAISSLTGSVLGQTVVYNGIPGTSVTFNFKKTGRFVTATFDPFTFTAPSTNYLYIESIIPSGWFPDRADSNNIISVTSGSNNVFGAIMYRTNGVIVILKRIDENNFISGNTYTIAGSGTSWTTAS